MKRNILRTLEVIFFVVAAIFALLLIIVLPQGDGASIAIVAIMLGAPTVLFACLAVWVHRKVPALTEKQVEKKVQRRKTQEQERAQASGEREAKRQAELQRKREAAEVAAEQKFAQMHTLQAAHAAGLPLAEGTKCTVFFDRESIKASGGGTIFSLENARVADVEIKTDKEIQTAYVSSVGGAIGGAVLFGALGAMVGGRAKEKKTETVSFYLIITYSKDEQIDYISFQVFDEKAASTIVREWKKSAAATPREVTL